MAQSNGNGSVRVEIYDQTYQLRGSDPEYIGKLADYVDTKMRLVAQQASTVDSLRVAVLAALNIADELFQARGQTGEAEKKALERAAAEMGARVEALARELDSVLTD